MLYKFFDSRLHIILLVMMTLTQTACNYLDDLGPQVKSESQQKSNNECLSDTHYLQPLSVRNTESFNNMDFYCQLPSQFGVGWGYNRNAGIINKEGVKGKILNERGLAEYTRKKEQPAFIDVDYMPYFHQWHNQNSNYESLSVEIATNCYAGVDLDVAKAEISVELSNLTTETDHIQYYYFSDMRNLKRVSLSNWIWRKLVKEEALSSILTDEFKKSVKEDPIEEIIRKFGTDLIVSSHLGGHFEYYFTAKTESDSQIEDVITTIQAKILWWTVSTSVNVEKTWQSIHSSFHGKHFVIGGGEYGTQLNQLFSDAFNNQQFPNTKPSAYDNWKDCFVSPSNVNPANLGMLDFQTKPISELIEPIDPIKANEIDKFLKNTKNKAIINSIK